LKSAYDTSDTSYKLRKFIRQGCPPKDLDSSCALKKITEIEDWMSHGDKFEILVTGKMGTGKTTLIEGLTKSLKREHDGLFPHTIKVTPYAYVHEGAHCIFYDTPGLKDDIDGSNDYGYIKEMVEDPDVLLFTIKMDDNELRDEDKHTISNITEAYGYKIWKKAMFILTFANMVTKKDAILVQNRLNFEDLILKLKIDILNHLMSAKVHHDDLAGLEFVPIGLVSDTKIPGVSRDVSWIDELWAAINNILNSSDKNKIYQ